MSGEACGGDAAAPVDELLVGEVHFPLEGGVPRVTTPSVPLAPGVSKQLMSRGLGEQPTRDCKCFGARRGQRAKMSDCANNAHNARFSPSPLPGLDSLHRRGG